jgi:hypothetical protein
LIEEVSRYVPDRVVPQTQHKLVLGMSTTQLALAFSFYLSACLCIYICI